MRAFAARLWSASAKREPQTMTFLKLPLLFADNADVRHLIRQETTRYVDWDSRMLDFYQGLFWPTLVVAENKLVEKWAPRVLTALWVDRVERLDENRWLTAVSASDRTNVTAALLNLPALL
ncbi:MAG: hypothetical protein ACP5I3_10985 [Thermoproteus sp.]